MSHHYRSTVLGKVFAALLMAGFVLWVLPSFRPTLPGLIVIFLGVGVLAETFGRFFSGESTWHILMVSALVIVALGLLFALGPPGFS